MLLSRDDGPAYALCAGASFKTALGVIRTREQRFTHAQPQPVEHRLVR